MKLIPTPREAGFTLVEVALTLAFVAVLTASYSIWAGYSDRETSAPKAESQKAAVVARPLKSNKDSLATSQAASRKAQKAIEDEARSAEAARVTLDELLTRYVRNFENLQQSLRAQDEVHYGEYQLEKQAIAGLIVSKIRTLAGQEEFTALIKREPESSNDMVDDLIDEIKRQTESAA